MPNTALIPDGNVTVDGVTLQAPGVSGQVSVERSRGPAG